MGKVCRRASQADSIACLSSVKRNRQLVQYGDALHYEWQSKAGEANTWVVSGV